MAPSYSRLFQAGCADSDKQNRIKSFNGRHATQEQKRVIAALTSCNNMNAFALSCVCGVEPKKLKNVLRQLISAGIVECERICAIKDSQFRLRQSP